MTQQPPGDRYVEYVPARRAGGELPDDEQHTPPARSRFAEQWRSYDSKPPVARWVSRISQLVGLAVAILLLLIGCAVVWKVAREVLGWALS